MARKNGNTEPKPKLRKLSGKGKPKPKRTSRPGGKPPRTPAEEEEVVVSRSIMRRHSGRGGRGR